VVGSDCNFLGVQEWTPAGYADQVECALSQTALLLDRLRALDILDRTAFIVTSDHGVDVTGIEEPMTWVLHHAAATLMVKPFGADGSPLFDPAPTSNQDLPEIVALLSGEGEGAAGYLPPQVNPERRRSFFFHAWQNSDWSKPYLTALHAFEVGPGAARESAWSYVGTTPSPDASPREQARLQADAAALFAPDASPAPQAPENAEPQPDPATVPNHEARPRI